MSGLESGKTAAREAPTAFERIAAVLVEEGGIDAVPVTPRRTFGSNGLRVNGKIFAMPVKGAVVLKLPRARATLLVEAGAGEHFDPGHGRRMKEWVVLCGPEEGWVGLAREAREFVRTGGR